MLGNASYVCLSIKCHMHGLCPMRQQNMQVQRKLSCCTETFPQSVNCPLLHADMYLLYHIMDMVFSSRTLACTKLHAC